MRLKMEARDEEKLSILATEGSAVAEDAAETATVSGCERAAAVAAAIGAAMECIGAGGERGDADVDCV